MGVYLYGIMSASVEVPQLVGVDNKHTLRGVPHGTLQAVVSDVEKDFLTRGQAADNPEVDLEAIAPFVMSHERTVGRLMMSGTILPTPFATVLVDEAAIVELLDARQADWNAELEAVLGCVELGVKAFVDREAFGEGEPATDGDDGDGKSYLLRKKQEMDARDVADRYVSEVLAGLHKACTAVAEDTRLKPIRERGNDPTRQLEMRAVYLVQESRIDDFTNLAAAFTEDHDDWLEVEVDGPFAPYHFVGGQQ